MEIRRARSAGSIRTEGGLLPSDLLEKIRAADPDVPGLRDADFGLPAGVRAREATTRSWNRLVGAWAALEAVRVGAEASDPLVGPTRDRFLLPLFEELGFGRLPVARAVEIEGTSYPISHSWQDRVPVHLVGYGVELDTRTKGVRGAAGAAPHALVQEYLNRADGALWGVVSNGRTLRLLRDSTSLTRQAYVEFDLEAIFEGELYADFALLWSVMHRSRVEGERPTDCLLERWTRKAADDGTRALDKLRGGVEKAIETLGAGFLATKGNTALVEALRSGELDSQDYYRELLRLVYRLIFLFTAEDRRDEETGRELLLDPAAPEEAAERYRRYYSTVRLRSFAGRRRGSRHPDLWVSLRRVIAALGSDGAPSVALPALGSFLFGPEACRHLDASELTNEALLDAVRALATIEEDRRLRLVDYRNLGAEELGGIYEGLLELHPRIELDANPPRFSLGTAAGHERKTSGSYYTPSVLIASLLDDALDPALERAVTGRDPTDGERALLDLAVVDPAAGSGHFVVAAAHRIAKRLAAIRTGEAEPSPSATRHALRDVISHCIYAVDVNPMAVELCRVSLWLEALDPGRPLSFLDAHIKCGNSLLGATPELISGGVPDAAYEVLTGDDRAAVRTLRDANRHERDGQQSLFGADLELPMTALVLAQQDVESLGDSTAEAVASQSRRHSEFESSADLVRSKAALDAWAAAFLGRRRGRDGAVTTETVRALAQGSITVSPDVRTEVAAVAGEYGLFNWPLEFPVVFARGGFDVVVGNPPWERVKLQEEEFFAERSPAIAGAPNAAARKRMIAALETSDPVLWTAFQEALRHSDGESHFLRNSGRYPLAGRGDINTYAVFVELMRTLRRPGGRVGVIVPTGVATDDTTKTLFGDIVVARDLVSLHDFVNDRGYFPGVGHGRQRFSLLVCGRGTDNATADLAFFLHTPDDLREQDVRFSLTPDDFRLLNPNTRTCPTFRGRRDAEIAKGVYRRIPVLIDETDADEGNPWGVTFMAMFHMANDSGLFLGEPGDGRVPLYEAKMVHQFNHRYGDYALRAPGSQDTELPRPAPEQLADPEYSLTPRYWIDSGHVQARLEGRWRREWLLGWRDICRSTDERTLISGAIPVSGVGDKFLLMFSEEPLFGLVLANLNSLALDWQVRQKLGGTSLKYYVLRQVPVLPPSAYLAPAPWAAMAIGDWARRYVVELAATTYSVLPFARDLGWTGGPFRWDEERRPHLRAELDAAFLHLYGHSRSEVEYILDSFPIVRRNEERRTGRYATGELVLDAYDRMAVATPASPFVSRVDPPPGSPSSSVVDAPAPDTWSEWTAIGRVMPKAPELTRLVDPPRGLAAPSRKAMKSARKGSHASTPALDFGTSTDGQSSWVSELSTDPSTLVLGVRVRHRSFGLGTLLSIATKGNSTQLLVRFDDSGEKWLAFGYGVLDFEVDGRTGG